MTNRTTLPLIQTLDREQPAMGDVLTLHFTLPYPKEPVQAAYTTMGSNAYYLVIPPQTDKPSKEFVGEIRGIIAQELENFGFKANKDFFLEDNDCIRFTQNPHAIIHRIEQNVAAQANGDGTVHGAYGVNTSMSYLLHLMDGITTDNGRGPRLKHTVCTGNHTLYTKGGQVWIERDGGDTLHYPVDKASKCWTLGEMLGKAAQAALTSSARREAESHDNQNTYAVA